MGDIMVLSFGTTVLGVIRALFSYIDAVVYWALVQIYNLFTDISRVDLFGSDGVGEFGTRIYTIIGVIMLFKLAFSILTYIIDPDKMSDNKNGFGSIIKNIVIMFVLIVAVPMIFRVSMGLQYLVLSDDTIGRLITGHSGGNYDSLGEKMSVMVLSTFVHPNEEYYSDCNGVITSTDANYDKCVSSLPADVKTEYRAVYEDEEHGRKNILKLARNTTKVSGYDDEFAITYHFILSPLVGIAISYIFLLFCIDVGVRTVKLAFLQLIAPIPIVTYIDNQGQGIFKKWVKVCTGTYADLFIRLAGIDFAIYLISEYIYGSELRICDWAIDGTRLYAHNCETPNIFVRLFLILGTLMFAKELPKLVEEITGLKLGGKFEMNPLKKLSDVPIVGTTGANLARKSLAGMDAMKNGHSFMSGWNKARENDKGLMADMRKSFNAAVPYSTARKKRDFEAHEQAEEQAAKLRKGHGYFDSVEAAKRGVQSTGDDWADEKAKNLAAGIALFGNKRELAKKYTEMMNAKSARDRSGSTLTEAKERLNAGQEFNGKSGAELAKYISELEVNNAKATSAYSAAEAQFVKDVNNDFDAREIYESYNLYSDQQKYADVGKVDKYAQGYTDSYNGTTRNNTNSSSSSADVDPMELMSEVQSNLYHSQQNNNNNN